MSDQFVTYLKLVGMPTAAEAGRKGDTNQSNVYALVVDFHLTEAWY